jgi:Eco57I restriction-modification methylase/restriction-modification enzyme MmeI-like protein
LAKLAKFPTIGWPSSSVVEPIGAELDKDIEDDGKRWAATPHARFERLLRETQVPVGLLTNGRSFRLIYAPKGETSGFATFDLKSMLEVSGRPMLSAFHMLLQTNRLFEASEQNLPSLLAESRQYQQTVSTQLAEQVLVALHELLRGLVAADNRVGKTRIVDLARRDPEHLYSGLLTALMRLVFILFAEDRDLFPRDPVWQQHYSLAGLFKRLRDDAALYPDTMDDRYGAWAQLLTLWRLVHSGGRHGSLKLIARRGRLFDPDRFPFLEGRDSAADAPEIAPLADGVVWRMLNALIVLNGERLSYRNLDVEQIGSVYQAVMGFTIELTQGISVAIRAAKRGGAAATINLEALLAQTPNKRAEWMRQRTDRKLTPTQAAPVKKAKSIDELESALATIIDERITPKPIAANVPVLQPTEARRKTGSHYTPRALTQPIVRDALRPQLERLGSEASPEQILELKVLDPAVGSGAFLVETCRQLAEALVATWAKHGSVPELPPDEDALLHAQRLVAQRCLYGIDRNAMAADLAKLSLWLATLARDHEFTFLDHAIRHGDALVGLFRDEIAGLSWREGGNVPFAGALVSDGIAKAERERTRIREAVEGMGEHELRPLLVRADKHLEDVNLVGDAVVAAFFSAARPAAREHARQEIIAGLDLGGTGWQERFRPRAAAIRKGAKPLDPFHWELQFPEVFLRDNPGFDAIVGNPPYAGKNTIIDGNPEYYLDWLQTIHDGAHGNADLVAHFFRRAYRLLRRGGTFGLIATKTIRQGDTRGTGLRWIRKNGGIIYTAKRRHKWPGEAAVVVSVLHIAKRQYSGNCSLDGRPVERITAYLVDDGGDDNPAQLVANAGKSFVGSYVLGMGFTFDDTDTKGVASPISLMRELIAKDPRNAERIFPYIGGEEVNTHPSHAHHRYIINFEDFPLRRDASLSSWSKSSAETRRTFLRAGVVPADYPDPVATDWPDLLAIVRERVKPGRLAQNDAGAKTYWWRFIRPRPELQAAIRGLDCVVSIPRVTKHVSFSFLPADTAMSEQLIVFAISKMSLFGILQSRVHEVWARFLGSSMKDDPRYNPSDIFETFPFPPNERINLALESAGRSYFQYRSELMRSMGEGMTSIYNRFNDPDDASKSVAELRRLHGVMDLAVFDAYGWSDIEPILVFEREWVDEDAGGPWRYRWPEPVRDEVLARLLALNADRAADEVRQGLTIERARRNEDPENSEEFELEAEES